MWTKLRLLSLLTALVFAASNSATIFEYDADGTQNQTIDGITVKLEKGGNTSNAPEYSSYVGMKLYNKNTITISAATAFKSVQLVCSKKDGKDYLTVTASEGNYVPGEASTAQDDYKVDTWTGESTNLVLTMGTKGQRLLWQIVVDGEPVVIDPTSYVDNTPLDPEYGYNEPTTVRSPEKNIYKKEYAFIDRNIRVHASQGSIVFNDSLKYFNCNADYSLTFEAAKPVKGLVINGAVRKLFTCSVDKGTVEYLSPDQFYPEDYQECSAAVVITDINDTQVTITCPKQLRCYSVKVYFEVNPTEEAGECEYLEGIESVPVLDRNAPMYDILGRKINDTYKGIVIQDGHKYLLH